MAKKKHPKITASKPKQVLAVKVAGKKNQKAAKFQAAAVKDALDKQLHAVYSIVQTKTQHLPKVSEDTLDGLAQDMCGL